MSWQIVNMEIIKRISYTDDSTRKLEKNKNRNLKQKVFFTNNREERVLCVFCVKNKHYSNEWLKVTIKGRSIIYTKFNKTTHSNRIQIQYKTKIEKRDRRDKFKRRVERKRHWCVTQIELTGLYLHQFGEENLLHTDENFYIMEEEIQSLWKMNWLII